MTEGWDDEDDETWEAFTARAVDAKLAALANPARRLALELLVSGDATAGDLAASIADTFGVSASRASQHLQVLARADLVRVNPDGLLRNYRLNETGLAEISAWIASLKLENEAGR